jgi:hypothetical protein
MPGSSFVDAPPPGAPAGTTGADAAAFQGGSALGSSGGAAQSWSQSAGPGWREPQVPYWVPAVPPKPRESSPLAWYAIAAALVALALVGIYDTATAFEVRPAQYVGAGILALGIGLIVGAWWGRARGLILAGLLVLPFAGFTSFLTVPLDGRNGNFSYEPTTIAELQDEYRVGMGSLWIDLTRVPPGGEPIDLTASVGLGQISVIVPNDANVLVDGTVEGGQLDLFGRHHEGTGLSDVVSLPGYSGGSTYVIHLEAGLGDVNVRRGLSAAEYEDAYVEELRANIAQLELMQVELEGALQEDLDPMVRVEVQAQIENIQAEIDGLRAEIEAHMEDN